MDTYPALVEVLRRASGESREQNHDTIILQLGFDIGREGGISKETLGIALFEANGVDIEVLLVALPQCLLHLGLLCCVGAGAAEPLLVGRASGVGEGERDAGTGVVLVHDVDLLLQLRVTLQVNSVR